MTKRKAILVAMLAATLPVPVLGGRVYRSRPANIWEGALPALVIRPAAESVQGLNEIAERDFAVQVLVFGRGEVPDDACDEVIEPVHAALCADPSFGGLAAHLFEEGSSWTFVDGNEQLCQLAVRYRVRLYTPEDNLAADI